MPKSGKRNNSAIPRTAGDCARIRLERLLLSNGLREGDLIPTARSLAKIWGMSRTPIIAALKEMEGKGLAAKHGPRRYRLKSKPEHAATPINSSVAILSGVRHTEWSVNYGPERVENGLLAEFSRRSLNCLHLGGKPFSGENVDWLVNARPLGVAVEHSIAMDPRSPKIAERLRADGIPVVVHSGLPEWDSFPRVAADQESGAFALADWLIAHGCRRILTVKSSNPRNYWMAQREAGMERACRKHGLSPLPPLIIQDFVKSDPDKSPMDEWIRSFIGCLFDRIGEADALALPSDGCCGAATRACEMLGRRPNKDIAIAGFDNYWDGIGKDIKGDIPPLASVDTLPFEIGRKMAETLLSSQEPGSPGVHREPVLVKTELVVAKGYESWRLEQ